MYRELKRKFLEVSISKRILLFFSSLIFVSLIITGFFFQEVYYQVMVKQIEESSLQTTSSVGTNIKTILDRVNSYSRILLSNSEIQTLLSSDDGYSEIALRENVDETLSQMTYSFQEIASIYLIDRNKRRYFTETRDVNSFDFDDYFYSGAWAKARLLRGSSYYVLDGGGIYVNHGSKRFISNIRVINSFFTQKAIGGIVINIPADFLQKAFEDITSSGETQVFIFNEDLRLITSSSSDLERAKRFVKSKDNNYIDRDSNLIYSKSYLDNYGWSVVIIKPLKGGKNTILYLVGALIALFILSLLVFWGSMIITKMITKPINILASEMSDIGSGNLKKVRFNTSIQEFNYLRDGYNKLTDEIETLIAKVVLQEKTKRKAELNTLQAQIKPHFLYNTFDSISSLALMGDNQQVYDMVTSLGNFYRISLSKGREVITLGEELDALKSYLKILSIRYDNFEVYFDLDKDMFNTSVLKLILQPFVENAIYHGIKPKGESGKIFISSKKVDNYLLISIEDDGVGMDQESIDQIFLGGSSFGVKGTVERINLFYSQDDMVKITSSKGSGTRVDIKIPLIMEAVYG